MKTFAFISTVLFCLSINLYAATYSGGDGTADDPYQIADTNDLLELAADTGNYDKCFILTADIDLDPNLPGGQVFTDAVIASMKAPNGWTPGFQGTIDGQGHKIKNLTIHADSVGNVGFIKTMEGGASVSNVCLEGIKIESLCLYNVGGMVGYAANTTIENCSVEGQIISVTQEYGCLCGGLAGSVGGYESRVENCYSDVDIQGGRLDMIGGLIGGNYYGIVSNCYATGWIGGTNYVGGLIYYTDPWVISDGLICNSFWDVETSGQTTSDGGTGLTTVQMQDPNTFLSAEWDFVGETVNGMNDIWQMPAGQYPHFVWEGFPDTSVPDIVGMTQSGAETAIIAASLAVGLVTPEYCDTVPAGIVISQSPAAGRSAYTGTGVRLTVSAGIAYYNNGSGTQNTPYRVSSATDLNTIGLRPEDWDKYFILVNDIDMSGRPWTQDNIIGNYDQPFTGTFDGDGHVIRNFTSITSGLFGWTVNAEIKNIGLEKIDVFLGSSLADTQDGGIISNCYSTGIVSGGSLVGGLVGTVQDGGLITNCHTSGRVEATYQWAGGLVGRLSSGTISNCYSTANVTGKQIIGGLVGRQDRGVISRSYSSGNVSGEYEIGGLVGEAGRDEMTISNCYATGDVNGKDEVGGLVGTAVIGVAIQNCYSAGHVTTEGQWQGGLVGNNFFVAVINSFWDIETSELALSDGGRGRTTVQMKAASNYIGWNSHAETVWVLDEGQDYPHLAWENTIGEPLSANAIGDFLPGSGTEADPYQVQDANDLNVIGRFPSEWDKYFSLAADIDMSPYTGTDYNIIGIDDEMPFTGVFEGNGYVIRNFTYVTERTEDYIGLFGALSGKVSHLGLENVTIQTAGSYVGGVTGQLLNNGVLDNCHSSGSVTATGNNGPYDSSGDIGGLAGNCDGSLITNCYSHCTVFGFGGVGGLVGGLDNYSEVTLVSNISNCYSTGTVNGFYTTGGLVGHIAMYCSISDCYSTGMVSGTSYIGGLVGNNDGNIGQCFSTGAVNGTSETGGLIGNRRVWSDSISSFWDTETSGQMASAGGEGKTTTEMKNILTFTSAGWDFTNEMANGTEDIWRMCVNDEDYPRLSWQFIKNGDFACPDGVSTNDLQRLSQDWLMTYSMASYGADANGDGTVNLNDFMILAEHWLN